MSFRHNLQHLRASRNMTQEQLAVMMGVSRQSVTKWESERAFPEMDKLIQLCSLFNCTLDELVTGDLTDRPVVPFDETCPHIVQDVYGYEEHMHIFAKGIARSVSIFFGSVALALLSSGFLSMSGQVNIHNELLVSVCVVLGICASVSLFIPTMADHTSFKHMHPYIHDFYTVAQKHDAHTEAGRAVAAGAMLVLLGTLTPLVTEGTSYQPLADGIMMALMSIASWLFAYFGILGKRVQIERYNKAAAKELNDEQILRSKLPEEHKSLLIRRKSWRLRMDAVRDSIMIAATIVSLGVLFVPMGLDMTESVPQFFWAPWAVGVALCGIATVLMDAFAQKE